MVEPRRVRIRVNGSLVEVEAGRILLEVLREQGIDVPTLCHDDRLAPYGGCRMCVVARRDGAHSSHHLAMRRGEKSGLVAACTTPIEDGMVIETEGPEVIEARRRQLQLLLLTHRMECPVCDRNGDCRLQELVHLYGVADDDVLGLEHHVAAPDADGKVILRDPEKCILCGRCVRLCDEVQGVAAIGFVGRGLGLQVSTAPGRELECEFCGQCVNACPTAALLARPYRSSIPAWLRQQTATTCCYCSCGCQLVVESHEGAVVRVTSRPTELPNRGKLCVKGWLGWDVLSSEERLLTPLIRRRGRLEEASWEEALEAVAGALRQARAPERTAAGICSPRLVCEDAYLFQRLMRCVVGSPHVGPGPEAGVSALVEGLGRVATAPRSTAGFDDLEVADTVLVLRADPSGTHPLIKTELVQAVRRRRTRLVMAHALSGDLGRLASPFLPLRPASEVALVCGLARELASAREGRGENGGGPRGLSEWLRSVQAYTPSVVESLTGLQAGQLGRAVAALEQARRLVVVVVTGRGIPGDEVEVTRAAAGLVTILEQAGIEAGLLVAGEKGNVQGIVDVGLHPALLPGFLDAAVEDDRRAYGEHCGGLVPPGPGWGVSEVFANAAEGRVDVLYVVEHDPAGVWPREICGREGVERAGFVVVQDTTLTETARLADVVLPTAALLETEGSVVGADGLRRRLRRVVKAPAGLPQGGEVFVRLASRLGSRLPTHRTLEEEIARLVPGEDRRPTIDRLVPAPAPTGAPADSGMVLDASPQLFHSGWVTARSRMLTDLAPLVVVRLCPDDASRLGILEGEMLRLSAGGREVLLRARVDPQVRPGTVVAPWNTRGDGAAALVASDGATTVVEIRRS